MRRLIQQLLYFDALLDMSTFTYKSIPNFYKPLFKTANQNKNKNINFFFISLSKQSIKHNHIKPKIMSGMNLNINLLTGHYATINCVRERNCSYRRKCEKLSADEEN